MMSIREKQSRITSKSEAKSNYVIEIEQFYLYKGSSQVENDSSNGLLQNINKLYKNY